jgi:putative hydroxymethylpyrimidine transport system ATP-binding protein
MALLDLAPPVAAPTLSAPRLDLTVERLDFDGVPLLRDFRLTLAAGKITCLLGPSGVGKSTLLRLIAGLRPEAEAVWQLSADDRGPIAGRVAYLAQQDLLLPWLDAAANVALGAQLRGDTDMTTAKARAAALLTDLGLGDALTKRPAALSGGMRQRVALARTLFEDRPIVVMDEPFSALDALTRFRLQALAAERLRHRTVLLVTHDPLEALRLGDVVYVLTGRPARLSADLAPATAPPRDLADPVLLARQAALLTELAGADT